MKGRMQDQMEGTATGQPNEALMDKLRKILALTTSPVEGEAQAAAAMLAKLLESHNLSMADLEHKGQAAPGVRESGYDLGKAAFQWKLDLAEAVATHYYCWPLVDRRAKTVAFVGRPDNVDALKALYGWLIEQIKGISATERRAHEAATGEHIDPLRWQVGFGIGCAQRLGDRLSEMRKREMEEAGSALVIHHNAEISDWLEEKFGYRMDGQKTKRERDREERAAADLRLREEDPEAFYEKYPYMRPERMAAAAVVVAERQAEWEKEWSKKEKARQRREERNGGPRYRYRQYTAEDERRDDQKDRATRAGREAAGKVNLQPFIGTSAAPAGSKRVGGRPQL